MIPFRAGCVDLARPRLHAALDAAIGHGGSDECINVERTGCPNGTDRELHAFDSQINCAPTVRVLRKPLETERY